MSQLYKNNFRAKGFQPKGNKLLFKHKKSIIVHEQLIDNLENIDSGSLATVAKLMKIREDDVMLFAQCYIQEADYIAKLRQQGNLI